MRLQEYLKQRKKIFCLYQLQSLLMLYLSLPMGCALTVLAQWSVRETGELLKTGSGGERGCAAQLSSGLMFDSKSTVVCGTKESKRIPHLALCSAAQVLLSASLCLRDT